jgi:hypothetical protein
MGARDGGPDEASVSDFSPTFRGDPPAAPEIVSEVRPGSRLAALLAGAGVALAGGLVWAGVVIATHFDIGILAWLVGAATATVVVRVAGGPVGTAERVVSGLLAAGGIMVGKYVIFVHAVKTSLGALLASAHLSVGYLDTRQMSLFVHHFGEIVRPVYALWVGLAFLAAVRVAGGAALLSRRR